jgi:putative FmdB family regulatory protein
LPLYEYQCPKCGRFELIRKFSDEALTKCPTCGSDIQKLLSAPAIQFKGTGWYITDYAKSGKSEPKSDGGKSAKSESSSKSEGSKSEGSKSEGGKSESSKSDSGKDAGSSSSTSSDSKPAAATSAATTATKDSGGGKSSGS